MPYIKQSQRVHLDKNPYAALEVGELNYVIVRTLQHSTTSDPMCDCNIEDRPEVVRNFVEGIIDAYLAKTGRRYHTYTEVLGVLSAVSMEWARRAGEKRNSHNLEVQMLLNEIENRLYDQEISEYQDRRKAENGDVF